MVLLKLIDVDKGGPSFMHIIQDYFTDTATVLQLPQNVDKISLHPVNMDIFHFS